MKYEVRGPKGQLFGTLNATFPGREYRTAYCPPVKIAPSPNLVIKTIVLTVSEDYAYRGQVIPTLVLTQGKRTWLKGMPGYSRL